MSVSSVGSSLDSSSSLLALLGSSSISASNTSASSLLSAGAATSSAGDAVTVDLSEIAKAASSGDSSARAAAVAQLKTDLAGEQTALLGSVETSGSSTTDIGDQLLSTVYGASSAGSLSSLSNNVGTTLNTTA